MPEFPVVLEDREGNKVRPAFEVKLNKLPKLGSDFEIAGIGVVRCKEVRVISGDRVIFAVIQDSTARESQLPI